jgi:hypothetical protein
LDDVRALVVAWCDEARRLCEVQVESSWEIASRRGEGASALLTARLGAIATGLRLRRRLDGLVPDPPTETSRRDVVRRLVELQALCDPELAGLERGTPRHREIAAWLRDALAATRISVQNVLTVLQFEPLHQAMAIEGLRAELEWQSAVVARLDGESPPPLGVWLDVELDRLHGFLGKLASQGPDPRDRPIRVHCEQLRAVLLERRVRRELARPIAGASPEALWVQRFHLARLQAQVAALDLSAGRDPSQAHVDGGPHEWLGELKRRRAELADAADQQIAALVPTDRVDPCKDLVRAALDETGEMIAFFEQMSPRRVVERLELAREDLERLAGSCRRWASDEPAVKSELGGGPESGSAERDGADGALDPRQDPASAGSAVASELDPGDAARFAGPSGSESATTEPPRNAGAVRTLRRQARRVERLARRVRGEWQEKVLSMRMEALLGRRAVKILENTVLVLIPVLIGLIAVEALLERSGPLSVIQHQFFAWADLAICSVFLLEFGLKLLLAPGKLAYLLRPEHLVIDLVASLPFGFVAHQIDLAGLAVPAAPDGALERLADFGRMAQVLRFARLALPVVRLARVGLILLRLADRLVRRMAGLLNRNIVLFEPASLQRPESSDRHRLLSLRFELEHARAAVESRLDRALGRRLAARVLADLDCRIDRLPPAEVAEASDDADQREIPVEALVERLIQMTPERLIDRMGPGFVAAVDRCLRLLDLPVLRRLPYIRDLVIYRQKSSAEAVALAANYLGQSIQRGLDVAYFLADLHGTLSPPVFLDRLGATIVNATRTPAKRLLWLGSAFLFLYLVVRLVRLLAPFRAVADKVQNLMGWPVIILGAICLAFWALGGWFRRIANQSADFCERVVEAQFAAHTKTLKSRRQDQDALFLSERVIEPELLLRASDDRLAIPDPPGKEDGSSRAGWFLFENREMAFLRNVRLLYQDYLDGSPLHRSDTKASIQLLGNLALSNLRRSNLGHLLRESRMLDRLDLSRSGSLFGGPYLWFNYITRMLVQGTALLILDYNRHAVPLDRLACAPGAIRERFRAWLSGRLKVDPAEIWLPDPAAPVGGRSASAAAGRPAAGERSTGRDGQPVDRRAGDPAPRLQDGIRPPGRPSGRNRPVRARRREADAFLETVEFTAVDFLADDAERDAEIHARFGPQVAELVRRDRQQNVRRAFRSFPLHELPLSMRTINLFSLYETHLAGGRLLLLPFDVIAALFRAVSMALRSVYRVVHEILHPRVEAERAIPSDTYWAALRKIHRMRKPVFMGSLWLRARFDVEYLGLALPSAPVGIAATSLMQADLDFIGATRQDRIIAEQVRLKHRRLLEWIGGWLRQFGWTFDELPAYLAREIPFLANRGGEALRALVAACVLDHDDVATLALSIEGLKRVLAYAADPSHDPKRLPAGLPEPIISLRTLWRPVHRLKRPVSLLFELPCFPAYDPAQRRQIVRCLRGHRRAVRGWIKVLLGQGGPDPWATVNARLREVLLRTDLWSDQILVLRAVQSLTMLDVQHNCELVWNLGGYTKAEPGGPEPDASPRGSLLQADRPVPTLN